MKKIEKIRLHATPNKLRRVWNIKPQTRVLTNKRRVKLDKIRKRESYEES